MATITADYHFQGRPSPKTFRFEQFRLTYSAAGRSRRLMSKAFKGPNPVAAMEGVRAFARRNPQPFVRGLSWSSSVDDMMGSPCGYAFITDANGLSQIKKEPAGYRIPRGTHLFSVVAGLGQDKVRLIIEDYGAARLRKGLVYGVKCAPMRSPATLDVIQLMTDPGLIIPGLDQAWRIVTVAATPAEATRQIEGYLAGYLDAQVSRWTSMRAQLTLDPGLGLTELPLALDT
jgi:hypothetical protein